MPSSSLSGVCSLILFPLFATGVNVTSGKFDAGVVDTGGKLPPASLTPAANLPPVSVNNTRGTGGKICPGVVDTGGNLSSVSLTPVANLPPVSLVHLDLRISPRIFEKIRNDPNVIIRGLG